MEHEPEELCRICLQRLQPEASYGLFVVPGLAKKLTACCALPVHIDDGYPNCICGVCYTRLQDLHEFQEMCLQSAQRYKSILDSKVFVQSEELLETVPAVAVDDDEPLNYDPLLNTKMELFPETEDVLKMLEHVNKDDAQFDEEDDKPLKQSSNNNNQVKIETNAVDSVEEQDCNTDDASSETDASSCKKVSTRTALRQSIIECHICHRKFKKVSRYHDHMKYHNDKLPHQCTVPDCSRGFTTANGLRLHVEHSHSETIQLHACTEAGCDKKFPRTRQLNWHLKKVHKRARDLNPKTYACSGCEKVFRCPMSLKKHVYKHDGKELPFPCNICGKRFVINSALKDHLMRHAGIKNYVCPYCGVGKTTRQEWNTHIAIHTNEKQFKCNLCAHASHNKQNLRMHIKIVHEKIRDFACQYCGKTFGKSNACKMHEMTHTGEKRCECKVCGKKFLYAKSLTKHLKTHEKRVLRAIEVYRKRQIEATTNDKVTTPPLPELPVIADNTKETHQKVADEILKVSKIIFWEIIKLPFYKKGSFLQKSKIIYIFLKWVFYYYIIN